MSLESHLNIWSVGMVLKLLIYLVTTSDSCLASCWYPSEGSIKYRAAHKIMRVQFISQAE